MYIGGEYQESANDWHQFCFQPFGHIFVATIELHSPDFLPQVPLLEVARAGKKSGSGRVGLGRFGFGPARGLNGPKNFGDFFPLTS